ncbi:hypothetical protein QQZ08_000114 [Neonectria magnoliae]|uniref:Uncharacterized protein n=1 Tax=Neonectria magnoliae TaxID=2732573 RepID=A0ABR1IHR0_9HYPO
MTHPSPDFQSTIWWQMNRSHRPHGDRDDVDLFAPGPSTYNANANAGSASSEHPADEGPDSQAMDSSVNMDLVRWNDGYEVYNNPMDWLSYVPEELPQELPEECVNVRNWMQGSPSSPLGPGVAVPWEPAPRKKKRVHDIIDVLGQVLPAPSTAPENPACTALASAPAPTSTQVKRSWSKCRTHSDSNDDEQCDPRRRKMAPPPKGPQTSAMHPTYPKAITQVIRQLNDEDFENSCEYCFFYLQEPYKYINKPWTSCGKPRAEISHIVAHAISDHGLIRGLNSQRQNQRYLTMCASHKSDSKGKSECDRCKDVEHWTEEDLANEAHEGESVCLRCYTQLPTKKDLYEHLKELSICIYRQDWPMRRKTRILYSVFCSSDVVPKFSPPPGAIRGDGARKRNEKVSRRASQKTQGMSNSQGPARAKILPTRTGQFPPHHPEFAGDVSGNYFPGPPAHALVPRQPMPSYIDVGPPQNTQEPTDYTSPFHGLNLTLPITQAESQSLLSSPSMPLSQVETQPILSSPSIPITQNETEPMLSAPSLPTQYQSMAGWQFRGQPMGKRFRYGSTDSGFVSRSNKDNDNRNPVFDENLIFGSDYFPDTFSDLPHG